MFRVIQREILLLVLASAGVTGLFFFTRDMAARNRGSNARMAAKWYELGTEQLGAGDTDGAIASFRKATVNDHSSAEYALALAGALAVGHHDDEARQALLKLRESRPEDPQINLGLARLAARHVQAQDAVRYYRNALYGLWTGDQVDRRRREVRLELIRFLLQRQDRSRAVAELVALGADLPEEAAAHVEVGRLFLDAGDPRQALSHFSHAVRLDRKIVSGFAGAGEAAFQIEDYAAARRYLEAALGLHPHLDSTVHLLETTRMVLANDPLAPNLTAEHRVRRLLANFEQALGRLAACGLNLSGELGVLRTEAEAMRARLRSRAALRDPELPRLGLDLIYRIENAAARQCGPPGRLDQALLLIGRKRLGEQ